MDLGVEASMPDWIFLPHHAVSKVRGRSCPKRKPLKTQLTILSNPNGSGVQRHLSLPTLKETGNSWVPWSFRKPVSGDVTSREHRSLPAASAAFTEISRKKTMT